MQLPDFSGSWTHLSYISAPVAALLSTGKGSLAPGESTQGNLDYMTCNAYMWLQKNKNLTLSNKLTHSFLKSLSLRAKNSIRPEIITTMPFIGGSDNKETDSNEGDPGSIPGSGRSPGKGNGNPSSILAWRIPWTEEPGGLQSMEAIPWHTVHGVPKIQTPLSH